MSVTRHKNTPTVEPSVLDEEGVCEAIGSDKLIESVVVSFQERVQELEGSILRDQMAEFLKSGETQARLKLKERLDQECVGAATSLSRRMVSEKLRLHRQLQERLAGEEAKERLVLQQQLEHEAQEAAAHIEKQKRLLEEEFAKQHDKKLEILRADAALQMQAAIGAVQEEFKLCFDMLVKQEEIELDQERRRLQAYEEHEVERSRVDLIEKELRDSGERLRLAKQREEEESRNCLAQRLVEEEAESRKRQTDALSREALETRQRLDQRLADEREAAEKRRLESLARERRQAAETRTSRRRQEEYEAAQRLKASLEDEMRIVEQIRRDRIEADEREAGERLRARLADEQRLAKDRLRTLLEAEERSASQRRTACLADEQRAADERLARALAEEQGSANLWRSESLACEEASAQERLAWCKDTWAAEKMVSEGRVDQSLERKTSEAAQRLRVTTISDTPRSRAGRAIGTLFAGVIKKESRDTKNAPTSSNVPIGSGEGQNDDIRVFGILNSLPKDVVRASIGECTTDRALAILRGCGDHSRQYLLSTVQEPVRTILERQLLADQSPATSQNQKAFMLFLDGFGQSNSAS